MEEQQAVLDESQEDVTTETQGTENQEAATQETQVDSATTEENTESDGVQKRINKLTAEKYAEKRQREALEARLEKLEKTPATEEVSQDGKPTLEQFDFDDTQYQSALIAYEVKQQVKANEAATKKAQTEATQRQVESTFDNSEVKYATENPEYVNDVQNLPQFNPSTLSMLKSQDEAPKLVHYLGKNLEVAERIASLDPMSAAVQIGIISANLAATTKQAVQTSTAPDPITPVTTGGSVSDNQSQHAAGATFE